MLRQIEITRMHYNYCFTGAMNIGSIAVLIAFGFSFATSSILKTCNRKPTGVLTPKSTNSHPFRIVFKGNVEYYVPGTTYTGKFFIIVTIP